MNQRRKRLHRHITQQETHVNEIKGTGRKHFTAEMMHILHHIADIRYMSKNIPPGLVDEVGTFIDPDNPHIGMPPRHLVGPRANAAAHVENLANAREIKPGWQKDRKSVV